ncbi:glycosyltransferase family 2 protein [Vibrio salilacus]|uniref:glycosyltransferase family 2 protein n=1 Tax=Vibrio salilacus TaxID=1323749 RepID=UPI000C2A0DF1|nr:glycosyltransferase family 2 protein [Vibrio salilacus]
MSELVSVITPCFKPGNSLLQTIASVQSQSYSNYEHIVIDDGSPGGFSEEVRNIASVDSRIKLIERKWNAGPAVTRNRGISEAKGRFIAFLDADDLWHPLKLEKQIKFMLKNNVALSYTSYEVFSATGKVLGCRVPPRQVTYFDILKSNRIGCLTAIYDTKLVGTMYMPNIQKRQDMGLWLSILKKSKTAQGLIDIPLARYRVGKSSLSAKKTSVLKYQWRIYREVEKLPLLSSMKYFAYYAYRGMTRKV